MENKETKTEEILLLNSWEDKVGKSGNSYVVFKTDKGNFSVFEGEIIKTLKANISKKVQVEVARNDRGFANIRKILNVVDELKPTKQAQLTDDNFAEARKAKDTCVYTSYAKDLFIALIQKPTTEKIDLGEFMTLSIKLIQQAKNSFAKD